MNNKIILFGNIIRIFYLSYVGYICCLKILNKYIDIAILGHTILNFRT